jgi:hypothetical protein
MAITISKTANIADDTSGGRPTAKYTAGTDVAAAVTPRTSPARTAQEPAADDGAANRPASDQRRGDEVDVGMDQIGSQNSLPRLG